VTSLYCQYLVFIPLVKGSTLSWEPNVLEPSAPALYRSFFFARAAFAQHPFFFFFFFWLFSASHHPTLLLAHCSSVPRSFALIPFVENTLYRSPCRHLAFLPLERPKSRGRVIQSLSGQRNNHQQSGQGRLRVLRFRLAVCNGKQRRGLFPTAYRLTSEISFSLSFIYPFISIVIEEYPCLLDMASGLVEGEIEGSDSDADSDSDEESICESINGSSLKRTSIQEHAKDELVDLDDLDLPRTRGM